MSAADLIAVLIARYLQYDWSKPKDPNNDHLIFSKGHASPLYYAMLKAVGAITDAEMMTFRKFGSRLQVHPTPAIPWLRVAAGPMRADWRSPEDPNKAHLICWKGHASPLYYAMLKAVGAITDAEMMTFRKFGSRLQGHPTPAIPWVDVATGSLGQGLPISVGV